MATQLTGPFEPAPLPFEERVLTLEAQGRLDEALELCEGVLDQDWNNAIAHNLKGLILDRMGRVKEAIEAYREATFANPDFVEASDNLREAQADRRSPLVEQAPSLARAAAICAALCVPVFVAASVMRFAVQPIWADGLASGNNPAASVIRLFVGGLPYGIAFLIVAQFTRPGAASVAHFLAGLFSSSASALATGWIVNVIWVLSGSDTITSASSIERLVYPALATILIGGALALMFGVKQKGWMVPIVASLCFVFMEVVDWGAVAGMLFPNEIATTAKWTDVVERMAMLTSATTAILFGAGVGATLQWHKLRAEDSDDEDDDDVSDDGMSFPIPSNADESG